MTILTDHPVPGGADPADPADPAVRALRQAQIAATAAAVVPTVLASQGMVALGHDVLRLPVVVALAIAVFLEIGLVASALLARASAVAGRPAGADAVAVWVLSAVSGTLSAAHELLSAPDAGGHRSWQHDAPSVLAAGVRLVAPLVAAWLWERVLVSTRRQLAARSLAEVRRDRRLLRLGAAALRVRRLESADAQAGGDRRPGRTRRARRVLDRRHIALLRHTAPTDPDLHRDIRTWLTTIGTVDHYPTITTTHRTLTTPTIARWVALPAATPTPQAPAPAPGHPTTTPTTPVADRLPAVGQGEAPSRTALQDAVQITPDPEPDTEPVDGPRDAPIPEAAVPAPQSPVTDRLPAVGQGEAAARTVLQDAVQLVLQYGQDMRGTQMAALLSARGHVGPEGGALTGRTGQRWVSKAAKHLTDSAPEDQADHPLRVVR